MTQSVEELRIPGCHRFTFQGALSGLPPGASAVGTATPGDGGTVGVVGVMHLMVGMCLADLRLHRVVPGTGLGVNFTTVQFHRVRAGAWQELGTLSIKSATAFDAATVSIPGSIALAINPLALLLKGDLLVVRLVDVEAGTPANITATVETR